MTEIEAYIRQAAIARGIDPDVAVRVAASEGGLTDPVRQAEGMVNGQREQSYGPFQLLMTGGVGSRALKAGIDPRDPAQWKRGVDFALNTAAQEGWGQWYGAAKSGIGNRTGLANARAAAIGAGVGPDGPKGQEEYAPPYIPGATDSPSESGGAYFGGTGLGTPAPTSPYSLVADKKDKKDTALEMMAKAAGSMGQTAQGWQQPQIEPTPAAARVDAPVVPVLDPQQAEYRRQMLAQIMARLNNQPMQGQV